MKRLRMLRQAMFVLSLAAAAFAAETPTLQQRIDSASGGDKESQYSLGMMYAKGDGIPQDIADLLLDLAASAGAEGLDFETWEELVVLGRQADGIPLVVKLAAIQTALEDPKRLVRLAELSTVEIPAWKVRQDARAAALASEQQAKYQTHRDAHATRAADVAAGGLE